MYDLLISFVEVFAAMSPWLVAGFFAAGVIAVWIPRAWVNRVMGSSPMMPPGEVLLDETPRGGTAGK